AVLAPAAHAAAAAQPRILYAGDWTGSMQIFAADPSGKAPLGQVTFDRPAGPCYSAAACGFARPLPSPDGRRLAYWSPGVGYQPQTLWLARADGTGAHATQKGIFIADTTRGRTRLVYPPPDNLVLLSQLELAFSPAGRLLAFTLGTIHILVLRTSRVRALVAAGHDIAWSPDGRRLL